MARFPDNVGHVLGSRRLRSHDSLAGRLTYLAWKGRDAVSGVAAYSRRPSAMPEADQTGGPRQRKAEPAFVAGDHAWTKP